MMKTLLFIILFTLGFGVLANAQPRDFPNELKGYQFFRNGKLKKVRMGLSRKSDVERIFGSSCEKSCDYDSKFTVSFRYLSLDDCMTTHTVRDRLMCPLDEFIGTVGAVTLKPKRSILFSEISTLRFTLHTGGGFMAKVNPGGGAQGNAGQVFYESFGDEYGLRYSIRRETSTLQTPGPEFMTGPLYSIDYGLSRELENKIFNAPFKANK